MYQPLRSSPTPSKLSPEDGDTFCSPTSSQDHHYHHYHHHHHSSVINQRRTMLTFMIMLVALATLLTIIRLTLSPGGLAMPNSSPPVPAAVLVPHSRIRTILNGQRSGLLASKLDSNRYKQINLVNNQPIVQSLLKTEKDTKQTNDDKQTKPKAKDSKENVLNQVSDSGLPQSTGNREESNGGGIGLGNNNKSALSSPQSTNPAITSLTADQRYEKEYRDELVPPTTILNTNNTVSGTKNTSNNNGTKLVAPIERKPKLIFDASDLEQTRSLKIDKSEGCGEANGAYADLVVIVNSAVFNFDARSAIRETWGKFAVERGALLYFMLGSTDDRSVQTRVEQEDQKYEDILQGRFYDNYYNLTLKTITMMGWIAKRCSKIRYVLKVDDDMLLNMQHIADFAEINPNFHRVIIGKLAKKWRPHRDPRNKWYVPRRAYDGVLYPNFVTGPAYFFTGDAARPLFDVAINDPNALFLEDVYMTGIVAERAGIKRFNHALMKNVHLKVDQCSYGKMMTSHKHTPDDIRRIWKLVYSGKKCETKAVAAAPAAQASKTSNANDSTPNKSPQAAAAIPAANANKKKT